MINHYDYAANEFFDGSDSDKRIATIFINDVSSKVSIYYLEKYIADGQLNVVQMAWHGGEPMAVDNKENPYASFSFEMQPTPYYYNKPAVGEKMFYPYTSKTIYLGLGSGTGLESRFEESMHYNVSKASSYKDLRFYLVFDLAEYAVPVEDEDPYVYSLCSSDIHIKDDNSFVNSMTNYSYSSVRPENERDIFDNPFSFNMDRCDMKFGESAPFWRVRARRFDYGYSALDLTSTGYIGEERSADILDTHIESVSLDNTDITSDFFFNMRGSIEAYTEKSLPGQKWDIKLDNRNVETEGIKGHAKLELSFTTKEKETLPVLQQVQFRNDEDRITNKFGEAADGRLMLGVGVFSMDYMDEPQEAWQSVWYDCADDAPELEVCYAPYGTDEWTRIDMTENEEKYYPVGVGHVMEASLDGVTERSANGWFDLRVRLTSPDGDSQTQTISPAFKVESLTGVSSIKEDSAITVEGNNITAPEDAEVYTIDGTRCDGKGLASGIYIVRTADTVRKVVIK